MSRLELDCRGMTCPRPVVELARVFGDLAVGDEVGVASDDPAAGPDLEAWCRMRGQEYVGREVAPDGVPTYVVRKAG